MKDKKVLVTGGSGFLGTNLIRRLTSTDIEITSIIKPNSNLFRLNGLEDKISFIKMEISSKTCFDDLVKDKDFLFHFAWQTDLKRSMESPKKDIENDIVGFVNILESCRKYNPNIKIIFPSTVTVTGQINIIKSNETEKENPLSIYDLNKLMAEKLLYMYNRNYGVKYACLRLSNVFGEYQRIDNPNRGVLNFMIGKALKGENLTVFGDGNFIRDYCYVQDYIDAFLLAAESDNTLGETYTLGSGIGMKFNNAVYKIKEFSEKIFKNSINIIWVPFPDNENKIVKRDFIADSSKFYHATGWKPKISFEDGLLRTMEFYKNEQ